jgi:peptidoglycan/xylan/chitin deacetylase (PgdA/CDA1 family)
MHQWRYPFALLGIVFVLIGYALWPKQRTIPVLIYHDIASTTQPADSYTVERGLFAQELEYLKQNGYTVLTFSSAQMLREQKQLPERPVILSLDDALPGQLLALEELRARAMTATFFIPSDLVGDSAHLNWSAVRMIAASGMEIGGHTANHLHLADLDTAGLEREITGDKQRIEAELGKTLIVFAYPFREKTDSAQATVGRAGYTIVRDSPEFRSSVLTNSFAVFLNAL